mgnify:CR=1 FL=1
MKEVIHCEIGEWDAGSVEQAQVRQAVYKCT